ncbi:NAD(P)H-dependent flavin oxidoreductase [Desulfovibrio cuneatus]|uniref:NAD(P)H-dependent flavin oxidoreductase n=1 Tax=Desulfovibrio cuneatus TaxID=159728 RepID=UPI0003F56D6B|nr:nitronate monooxygenase [Desulfovibrio cuneatus]
MPFPSLSIGDLTAKLPIVQGGMGVGISLHRLAAAVAAEGGIGVIAGAMIGMREHDIAKDPQTANARALAAEIVKARALTDGVLGVNIMVVLTDFSNLVRTSIANRADVIFSGAGLPMELPKIFRTMCEEKKEDFKTKLVPIISSARAASILCKKWLLKADYLPDAFVLEGPKAGGHLGFKPEDLNDPEYSLDTVLPQVLDSLKPFEDKYGRAIPVIAAGGVYTGGDIHKYLTMGAAGVQMGTRFVATEECDADIRFKQAIVNAKEEDLTIIKSPVGMPGRAIRGRFLEALEEGKKNFKCVFHCVSTCDPETSPYCIAQALLNAMKGNLDRGFAFIGANGPRVDCITTVKELIHSLQVEYDAAVQAARA